MTKQLKELTILNQTIESVIAILEVAIQDSTSNADADKLTEVAISILKDEL